MSLPTDMDTTTTLSHPDVCTKQVGVIPGQQTVPLYPRVYMLYLSTVCFKQTQNCTYVVGMLVDLYFVSECVCVLCLVLHVLY